MNVWTRHVTSDRERARRWAQGRGCRVCGLWIEMGNRDNYIDLQVWRLHRQRARVRLLLRRWLPSADDRAWSYRLQRWLPMPSGFPDNDEGWSVLALLQR